MVVAISCTQCVTCPALARYPQAGISSATTATYLLYRKHANIAYYMLAYARDAAKLPQLAAACKHARLVCMRQRQSIWMIKPMMSHVAYHCQTKRYKHCNAGRVGGVASALIAGAAKRPLGL